MDDWDRGPHDRHERTNAYWDGDGSRATSWQSTFSSRSTSTTIGTGVGAVTTLRFHDRFPSKDVFILRHLHNILSIGLLIAALFIGSLISNKVTDFYDAFLAYIGLSWAPRVDLSTLGSIPARFVVASARWLWG